jgi:flagellar biosynthetic protein FlhB
VPQALTLVVIVLVLPTMLSRLGNLLIVGWEEALLSADPRDPAPALSVFSDLLAQSLLLLLPLVAGTVVAAVVARAVLGGVHLNLYQLKPKPKLLNPFPGIKRLFSVRQLGQFVRLFLKLVALAAVAIVLWDRFLTAVFTGPAGLETLVSGVGNATWSLLLAVMAVSLVAGGADGVLALRRYRKDLRMSRQEVRDEMRQTEANPLVKNEVRARQRKMSRLRMMAEVTRADVVLTNPTHLAVALRYEPGSAAPRVVAKGAGHIAARIRQIATENGVPIQENKPLARALFKSVEIGEAIPVQFYQAVAEVLAVVYRAAERRGKRAGVA